ncbi:MAG: hypothetical protein QOH04_2913 [Sphingomonadales bacterium]|nr:hypothetical protein [Sphingomonadales bacterium]
MSGQGTLLGSTPLPAGFTVRRVDLGSAVVLKGDSFEVRIPREMELRRRDPLRLSPLSSDDTGARRSGGVLLLANAGAGADAPMAVAPLGGGEVLVATYLGRDAGGARYVYWEQRSGNRVAAFAGRFGRNGHVETSVAIDLSAFVDIPALPVALAGPNRLLLMEPLARSVELKSISLPEGRSAAPPPTAVGPAPSHALDLGDSDEQPIEEQVPSRRAPPPYDPAVGAQILARAGAYQSASWTMRAENFSHPQIPNICNKAAHQYWKGPIQFSPAQVGTPIRGIPYKWGGFDSVTTFVARVAGSDAALAGDVCTCREPEYGQCMVPEAAGVDCSGFVSRAWGLSRHFGTGALGSVSGRLPSLSALQPGDALNHPGSHVRLFVRREPGPEVRYRVIESAVSCGGVCENTYTPAELSRYVPIRWSGM